ncbi:MAG: hypothetical protein WAM97_18825 [Acidimicrobiales bacterium]
MCRVTSSDEEFVSLLLPGDVLLFDSSLVTSALIKFADNCPVNHCGLFVGKENFAHVTHPENDHPALEVADIFSRLAKHYDYSVTALRHTGADQDVGAPGVVECMEIFRSGPTSYAYLTLISLFVPAFLRSYRPNLRPDRLVPRGLEWAEQAFLSSMNFDNEWRDVAPDSTRSKTLTCSQFVFLCYEIASPPLPITVRQPLARYQRTDRARLRGTDEGLGVLGFDFHPSLRDDAVDDGVPDVVFRGDPRLNKELIYAAKDLMTNICRRNWALGNPESPPREGQVIPELVTPKDLWSSPSLTSRAILVRAAADGPRGLLEDK